MKTWQKVLLGIISTGVIAFVGLVIYMFNIFKVLDRVELVNENVKETIPFYYSPSRHMIVEVRINGSKEKYPFILDSGATTYVFKNMLDQQDLPDIGNGFAIGAGGGMLFPDIHQIDQLMLGNIEFKNVSAESIEKLPISCTDDIYGILGKEAMQHLVWQIDFEKEEIQVVSELDQLAFEEAIDTIKLSENPFGHQLYVTAKLGADSLKTRLTVDLGNSGYASTNIKEVEKVKGRSIDMIGNASVGLDGENKSKAMVQEIENFQIGDIILPRFSVSASDTPMGLLGLGFLKNYKMTISWKDDALILEPYAQQYFGRKGFGFGARYDEKANALIIKSIYMGFAANKVGLLPGAKVISLNGALMDTADKYCAFSFKGFEQLTMTFEQDGVEQTVVLDKMDYFPVEETETALLSDLND